MCDTNRGLHVKITKRLMGSRRVIDRTKEDSFGHNFLNNDESCTNDRSTSFSLS